MSELSSHLPSRKICSDQPGRAFDSTGQGWHAMELPTKLHSHGKKHFTHLIAALLDKD